MSRTRCESSWQARVCAHLGSRTHGRGTTFSPTTANPDGQIIELYAELDQMSDETLGYFDPQPWHEEFPQRPKIWEPGGPDFQHLGCSRSPKLSRLSRARS